MIHWLKPPKSSTIAEYVECYWMIEKTSEFDSNNSPKLNPDPSAHLILSPSDQTYSFDIESNIIKGHGCHWIYPHHKTFQLDHSKPFIHVGIKFRVGALYSIELRNYSHPTLDRVEEVTPDIILGVDDISWLIELAKNDPEQCCNQLDDLLFPWIEKSKQDRHSELVRKSLQLLDTATISELGDKLFCSQRTLERSFSRVTGFSLKQCQSMNKLEAMLEYLYQRNSNDIDWVEVALMFGFSDQPHLIRYLKSHLGLTPGSYVKERGLTIDVYGGISSL
ncbi:helix-turn-helix domain-containing protein [Shewanella sp.]|uniref:helix-turn-helix domain-containing protein n=1 Tax=Shewanella sp. TaxID=50422 RepID=UPI00258A6869|nr:helix-turn-helix domain-containing protein [Shewanella sp.]MCJ8303110.1 helix-turn-helix domain-containing protein [Shewanella sp.]